MSTEEERVRQVSGKPRRRARKPEQNADRGAKVTEGALLPEGRPQLRPPLPSSSFPRSAELAVKRLGVLSPSN